MTEWLKCKVVGKHEYIKNKNASYVLIDEENKEQVADETRAFEALDNCLLTGFLRFTKYPCYMICLNPNSNRRKKYIFESVTVFEGYTLPEVLEEIEND